MKVWRLLCAMRFTSPQAGAVVALCFALPGACDDQSTCKFGRSLGATGFAYAARMVKERERLRTEELVKPT
jgi:hypothetical protein